MWTIEQLDKLTIKSGKHEKPNGGVEACAMEVAYLRWAVKQGFPKKEIVAGWTDRLDCIDVCIGAFVRSWNDAFRDDAARTCIFSPDLLDLLPGTKAGDSLMLRRMWMCIDWDIRTRTPAFLRLASLEACAIAIETLPPIASRTDLANAVSACEEARRQGAAAWDADRDAAWSTAWEADWTAARTAARDAAGAAARAVARDADRAAAWNAARDAAWNATGAAAGAAARDALRQTVESIRVSARDLIVRMCKEMST